MGLMSMAINHPIHARKVSTAESLVCPQAKGLGKGGEQGLPDMSLVDTDGSDHSPGLGGDGEIEGYCFVALEKLGIYRVQGEDLVGRRILDEYRRLAQLELAYAKELGFTLGSRAAMRIDVLQDDDLAAKAAKIRNGAE